MNRVTAAARILLIACAAVAVTVVLLWVGVPFGLAPLIPITIAYIWLAVNDFVLRRAALKNLDSDYQSLLDGYQRGR